VVGRRHYLRELMNDAGEHVWSMLSYSLPIVDRASANVLGDPIPRVKRKSRYR
jgi:hypothetical protein